jgi:mRNA-degrading endonuclease YafQ of YafQ-DinJ toxin-antitoxin module
MIFETTKKFKKQVSVLDIKAKNKLFDRLRLFSEDRNNGLLNIHPLRGNLIGFYSFSVSGDIRVHFVWKNKKKTKVLLVGIGTHSEMYG